MLTRAQLRGQGLGLALLLDGDLLREGLDVGCGHGDVAFLGDDGAHLGANFLDLVVEGPLFVEVAQLVLVGLVLEVVAPLLVKRLPLPAHLLHHLQGTHLLVLLHDQGPSLEGERILITSLTKIM